MAIKITNVQTEVEFTLEAGANAKKATSFEALAFWNGQVAANHENFWTRMELLGALKNKPVGEEVELTDAQAKEATAILKQLRFVVDEKWAVLVTAFKPLL